MSRLGSMTTPSEAGVAQLVERVALNYKIKEYKPQGRGFEPRLRLYCMYVSRLGVCV